MMSNKQVVFVSGHGDLSQEEFVEHYLPEINEWLYQGADFVVGDFKGTDTFLQKYFDEFGYHNRLTVYHMFEAPRVNIGNFKTKGGYTSDEERDTAMTKDSTYDVAWVRKGREKSGTAKNLKRR